MLFVCTTFPFFFNSDEFGERLEIEDYDPDVVSSVEEAYQWFEKHGKPDRLICNNFSIACDQNYDGDGYTFLIDLNRDNRYNDIPFVLVGAYDDHPWTWGYAKPELPEQLCFWTTMHCKHDDFWEMLEQCPGDAPYGYGKAPQEAQHFSSPRIKYVRRHGPNNGDVN